MCGIVSIKRIAGVQASRSVIKRYQKQKSRGTEGYGYMAINNGRVVSIKRAKHEGEILAMLCKESANEILFHHRKPTGTPNLVGLTHPIVVSNEMLNYDYVVVHNGSVTNTIELKREHESLGIKYTTSFVAKNTKVTETLEEVTFSNGFVEPNQKISKDITITNTSGHNDSESLAVELALTIEGYKDSLGVRGSFATICYQLNKDGSDGIIGASVNRIYFGRNIGRPLKIESIGKNNKKDSMLSLCSEGSGVEVSTEVLQYIEYANPKTTLNSKIVIGTPTYGTAHGKYNYYYDGTWHDTPRVVDDQTLYTTRKPVVHGFRDRDEDEGKRDYLASNYGIYDEEEKYGSDTERALIESYEKEANDAIIVHSNEIVDEMKALADRRESLERLTTYGYNKDRRDIMMEIDDIDTEMEALREEFDVVREQLISADLPVPSIVPFTIVY